MKSAPSVLSGKERTIIVSQVNEKKIISVYQENLVLTHCFLFTSIDKRTTANFFLITATVCLHNLLSTEIPSCMFWSSKSMLRIKIKNFAGARSKWFFSWKKLRPLFFTNCRVTGDCQIFNVLHPKVSNMEITSRNFSVTAQIKVKEHKPL